MTLVAALMFLLSSDAADAQETDLDRGIEGEWSAIRTSNFTDCEVGWRPFMRFAALDAPRT